jgi:error-prone DNA polymerase
VSDLSNALARVGGRDTTLPLPHGRGDELHHASPRLALRGLPPKGPEALDIHIPDLPIDTIKLKMREFR